MYMYICLLLLATSLRHRLHPQIYCTGSSGCGEHLGVACTESHLLLLGPRRAVTASDDSRRAVTASDDSRCTDDATSRHDQGQLKLLLRIRKRYKKAVVSKSFAFLVCDDAGTLDIFQVAHFHVHTPEVELIYPFLALNL